MQLLHHGYTYDSEFVRHIIGDTHGEIISSVRLRFSHCIKMQYGRCLQELKDLLLPWACGLTENISVHVLSLVNTNKILKDICGGQHGLVQQLCLWKKLMLLKRPLPPLSRIIPAIHAEWNVKKTASDTITKMIDGSNNRIIPPMAYINSNTIAAARTINYAVITCHKIQQLFSSDLEMKQSSLRNFRAAANKRISYKDTVRVGIRIFQAWDKEENEAGSLCPSIQPPTKSILAQRVRIHGILNLEKIELSIFTGKTPLKKAKEGYEAVDKSIPQETTIAGITALGLQYLS